MLRTALRPKWVAVLALALLFATGCAWLGNWQWQRAHEKAPVATDISSKPAVELAAVLQPQQPLTGTALAAPVRVSGRLDTSRMVFVAPRERNGQQGHWMVAPLLVPQPGGGTANLPVVLGWFPNVAGTQAMIVPNTVTQGVLQQPEPPGPAPHGSTFEALSTAQLVQRWGAPMYTAYLLPTDGVDRSQMVPLPTPEPSGLALQNLSYALQWFLFAGFAVFIWYRMVRDDHQDRAAADQ